MPLPSSRKILCGPHLRIENFLENKGFGELLTEISEREMPTEIFENRKIGLRGLTLAQNSKCCRLLLFRRPKCDALVTSAPLPSRY